MIKIAHKKFNVLRKYLGTPIPKNSNSRRRRLLLKLLPAIFATTALFPRSSPGRQKDSASSATASSGPGSTLRADLLLYNGRIITLDKGSRISEAVAVRASKILAVGEDAELKKQVPPETRRIDLKGRTVLPGFFDAHPHMDREGLKTLGGESLAGADSVAAIVERVAEAARRAGPGEWIVFMPMGSPPFDYVNDANMLREGRFPNRHDLDRAAPGNPVYIRSVWGWWARPPFPAVANSAAMRRCGITAASADPYNIEIVRDGSGNPTGVFLETNRTSLLEFTLFRNVPRFSYEDRLESVRVGSDIYSALGTTSAYETHGLTPALIRAYREIDERGELKVRMSAPLSLPSSAVSRADLSKMLRQWAPLAGGRDMPAGNFRVSGVTLDHADPQVAAPIARDYPYVQWAGHFYQALTHAEFVEIGIEAARQKLRLHFLIAEAPPRYRVDSTLDMLEEIDRQAPIRDLRCVGFHMLHATPAQIRRIRELGLVVTFTPSFIYSQAAALRLDKLGQAAFPIRELLDAGIPVALGSDNVPPSMLFTAWEALERWDEIGQRRLGESRLTREEVLRISCQAPHYLNREEDSRGRIAGGMAADLAVFDADPLTCDISQLANLKPVLTMVDGRIFDVGIEPLLRPDEY